MNSQPITAQLSVASRGDDRRTEAVTIKAPMKFKSSFPRASTNPFREGTSYGICYDILCANPLGMSRQKVIEELSKATGKSLQNAGFDAAIILSARREFRHSSCQPGFICIQENGNIRLEVIDTENRAESECFSRSVRNSGVQSDSST